MQVFRELLLKYLDLWLNFQIILQFNDRQQLMHIIN